MLVFVAVTAFVFQYLSLSFGLGYGTAVTPILLLVGFSPMEVIPAVLLSQFAGGVIGGVIHQRVGNLIVLNVNGYAEFQEKKLALPSWLSMADDSKVVLVLACLGIVGVVIGVFAAVNIPKIVLETYIGLLVLGVGVSVILGRSPQGAFSWRKLIAIGTIGAVNKGMSGGGYVPLISGGQIVAGREATSSVASTAVAVSIVSAVGFLSYLLIEGNVYWRLVIATLIGAIIAAPLAPFATKRIGARRLQLKLIIGVVTVLLGTCTLVRAFV